MEPLAIVAIALGSGGLGSFLTAAYQGWRLSKTVPVEVKSMDAKVQVDLVGAAGELIQHLQAQVESLSARLSTVEGELHEARQLAAEREHELEAYRLRVASQDERIARQEARIETLETEVRRLGGNPDDLSTLSLRPEITD